MNDGEQLYIATMPPGCRAASYMHGRGDAQLERLASSAKNKPRMMASAARPATATTTKARCACERVRCAAGSSPILLLGSSSALARRLAATQRPLRLRARGWINKCGCPSLFLFMWALSWSGQGVRASQGLMGQDLLSGHTRALHPFVCRPWFSSFWSSVRALAP